MGGSSKAVEISRVSGDQSQTESDDVAVEEPLEIQLSSPTAEGSAAKSISITMRTPGDDDILAVLTKMVKQRRDSVAQYESAGRQDLADAEQAEITVLEEFMPQPLTDEEVAVLIESAIAESGAAGMQDMGKVMGVLKPQIQGRADMGKVSGLVRSKLA